MRREVPFPQKCFIVDAFVADKAGISVKPMDAPLYVHDCREENAFTSKKFFNLTAHDKVIAYTSQL